MDRFDRIFDLHKLLSGARLPVPRRRIEEELECSRATAKRIIEAMRLYLNAPIKYDRERNGYYYDSTEGGMYELPGVWFNASELHALLTLQQLLSELQPGLLEQQLAPIAQRIETLLQNQKLGGDQLSQKIRLLRASARLPGPVFQRISDALACSKQLKIMHHHRGRGETLQRRVSPQRLVHYRDNWYLDAWCHLRDDLRTFALDAIDTARTLDAQAKQIDKETLDTHFSATYGIFSGSPNHKAVLRFSPKIAPWIANEQWHPKQQGEWLKDGGYQLSLPYGNSTELVMDILRYGPLVEVLAPEALRSEVRKALEQALYQYSDK